MSKVTAIHQEGIQKSLDYLDICPGCSTPFLKGCGHDICNRCEEEMVQADLDWKEGLTCPKCLTPLANGVYCGTCNLNWQ